MFEGRDVRGWDFYAYGEADAPVLEGWKPLCECLLALSCGGSCLLRDDGPAEFELIQKVICFLEVSRVRRRKADPITLTAWRRIVVPLAEARHMHSLGTSARRAVLWWSWKAPTTFRSGSCGENAKQATTKTGDCRSALRQGKRHASIHH